MGDPKDFAASARFNMELRFLVVRISSYQLLELRVEFSSQLKDPVELELCEQKFFNDKGEQRSCGLAKRGPKVEVVSRQSYNN